jgi:hypothetical protein
MKLIRVFRYAVNLLIMVLFGLVVNPPAWMAERPGILPAKIAAISCACRRIATAVTKLVAICDIAGLRIRSTFHAGVHGADAGGVM